MKMKSYIFLLFIIFFSCKEKLNNNLKLECYFFYLPNCVISETKLVKFISLKDSFNNKIDFNLIYIDYDLEESKNYTYQKDLNKMNGIKIFKQNSKQYLSKFEIKTVPYCMLLKNGNIVYQGAIDDEYIDIKSKKEIKNNYLIDAINSAIQNKKIKIKKTKAIGCKV
jgi:hypothetical protein